MFLSRFLAIQEPKQNAAKSSSKCSRDPTKNFSMQYASSKSKIGPQNDNFLYRRVVRNAGTSKSSEGASVFEENHVPTRDRATQIQYQFVSNPRIGEGSMKMPRMVR